jgi:hypothetical protein
MSFIRVKTIQTRDCYYPIYFATALRNHANGFYFFDEEFEEMGARKGNYGEGYFGPYKTLNDVCKAQAAHYRSISSL